MDGHLLPSSVLTVFCIAYTAILMPSFLQVAIFIVLEVIVLAIMPPVGVVAGTVIALLVASAAKVANQWQHAIVLRVGKFYGVRGPGLFWIIPIVDRVRMIDTRISRITFLDKKSSHATTCRLPSTACCSTA